MFLENIEMTFMAPCVSEENKIRLIAQMSTDITEVMPYLNAKIRNATYNKDTSTITFMKEVRLITLYPRKIFMAKIKNVTDAWQTLDWIKDTINELYENRDKIKPDYQRRVRITALELYGWLPKTNCRECGELTCLAFAVKLLLGQQKIVNCKPLFKPENAKMKEMIFNVVSALGYEV